MTRIVTCVLLIIVISKHGAKEMGNVKMAGPGFVNDVTRGGSRISSWGGALNKLRRAEGGAKIFGVFRVKNHDLTPKKSYFFQF